MKIFRTAIAGILLLCASCSGKTEQSKEKEGAENKTTTVKAFLLKSDTVAKQTSLPGELLPYERVQVHAKVSGYLGKINVDIGSQVTKGTVIAVIDAPEIKSRASETSGKKISAEARFKTSKDTYYRLVEAAKSKGVVSPNDLQIAMNKMMSDSADYQAAISAYDAAKQTENYLVITAPFSGTITKRNADEGTYVGNPNEKPIVEIEDNSRLRLRVAVPEALTGVQLNNNKIKFSTRGVPDKQFEAGLARKAGSVDAATRSEIWEFDVPNANHQLKAGMFADVKLSISRVGNSFVVQFSAVATTLEKKFVIRVSNGKTEWVDVSQGLNLADRTEIFGKLVEGDTLVLKANEELKPNTKVAPDLGK